MNWSIGCVNSLALENTLNYATLSAKGLALFLLEALTTDVGLPKLLVFVLSHRRRNGRCRMNSIGAGGGGE